MSTRGAFGFRLMGHDFVTYNHSDSYPSGLGESVLAQLKTLLGKYSIEDLKMKVSEIKLVKSDSKASPEEFEKLKQFASVSVSERDVTVWYCLLRGLQGDLEKIVEYGYMINSERFLYDSLFCEWAYIIDLDTQKLEVYSGFVKSQGTGRYDSKKETGEEYWGVTLRKNYSFKNLPAKMPNLKRK